MNTNVVKMERTKNNIRTSMRRIVVSMIAVLIALLVCMIVMAASGANPIYAFACLMEGAFGSVNALAETIVKMSPLLFTGMSYALAYRCGLTNLGAEGQLYMGAIAATAAGVYISGLPMYLHIPICILAACAGGGIWGLIPGILKVKFGASEIITTVMLNTVATQFAAYMVNGPMMDTSSNNSQTYAVADSAVLPTIIEGTRAHFGFFIGIFFLILMWIFLWKSKKGFELRISGFSRRAAQYSGISTGKNIMLVMFLAGALGGLAGCNEILGVQIRMVSTISPGYGTDGIAVALIGMNHPAGIFVGALLFGALRAGGNRMQILTKVPTAIINIIQAVVIITIVASNYFIDKIDANALKKKQVVWCIQEPEHDEIKQEGGNRDA